MENLAEILDRVAAAAIWQRERADRASKEAIQAHDGTGDFSEVSEMTRQWFEGNACGIHSGRRDAANILDSIAVALAAIVGTEVPDGHAARERVLAKAREQVSLPTFGS